MKEELKVYYIKKEDGTIVEKVFGSAQNAKLASHRYKNSTVVECDPVENGVSFTSKKVKGKYEWTRNYRLSDFLDNL